MNYIVQSTENSNSGASVLVLTLSSPTAAGTSLILAVGFDSPFNLSSVVGGGVSWTDQCNSNSSVGNIKSQIWTAPVGAGGFTTVTVTFSGTTVITEAVLAETWGVDFTATPVLGTNGGAGTGISVSVFGSGPNKIGFQSIFGSQTVIAVPATTAINTLPDRVSLSYIVNAANNYFYTGTLSSSGNWAQSIAIFAPGNFTTSASEALTLAEVKQAGVSSAYTDAINLIDVVLTGVGLNYTDTVSVIDVVLAGVSAAYTDAISLIDLVLTSGNSNYNDTVSLSDVVLAGVGANYADIINLSDVVLAGVGAKLADTMNLIDVVSTVIYIAVPHPPITINAPISPPPQQLCSVATTTSGPTITGPTDGINNLFTWQVVFNRIEVYRNGVAQTIGQNFSNGQTAAVFLPGSIPQPGDILTIYGWP